MTELPGAETASDYLRRTCLRNFGTPRPDDDARPRKFVKTTLSPLDAPVPRLLAYALELIGIPAHGPGEKVEWWINFTYEGTDCTLAHEKFGVRIYVYTDGDEAVTRALTVRIIHKLEATTRTVERLILNASPELLRHGKATVVNQHRNLRRAYDYFRDRAVNPAVIEDETIEDETIEFDGSDGTDLAGWSFKSGRAQMNLNAFHDLVAALTAYLSALEHDLVLALPFTDFDPTKDNLTGFIGFRWGQKFDRVFGQDKDKDARGYKTRLTVVVERWRNPYSHGGFEKGNGSTVWLHAPGVGAVPVGLTSTRSRLALAYGPAVESDITSVFALLDELDEWLLRRLPDAMAWIDSGLDCRFDETFRAGVRAAQEAGLFPAFLRRAEYRQAMVDNMDY